jgi:hypothetical protein
VHHRQQGGRLQAHGASETEMVFGHAEGLSWSHQHPGATTHLQRHALRGEGIGADRASRAVLFRGSQGNDHPFASLEVIVDLGPAAQGQTDRFGAVHRPRNICGHRWPLSALNDCSVGGAVAVVFVGVVVAAAGPEEQAGQREQNNAAEQHGAEVET